MHKDIPWIHLLRGIACLMVVCLHCQTAANFYPLDEGTRHFDSVVSLVTKPCVPLFFMITGYLILPYKYGNDIMSFYKKKNTTCVFSTNCLGNNLRHTSILLRDVLCKENGLRNTSLAHKSSSNSRWYIMVSVHTNWHLSDHSFYHRANLCKQADTSALANSLDSNLCRLHRKTVCARYIRAK